MKFTESHEWITLDGGMIGVTSHAQAELGDIVYVELPSLGKHVKANEELVVLESTKAAADVYSPVSGEVVAVNETLMENPGLINTAPEKEGWLVKIKLNNPQELDGLLSKQDYLKLFN